jgi:hypothetical protein
VRIRALCGNYHNKVERKDCSKPSMCGTWTSWSSWNTVDDFTQSAIRNCFGEEPLLCIGEKVKQRKLTSWSKWQHQASKARIYRERVACYDSDNCDDPEMEIESCENVACPKWSEFSNWESEDNLEIFTRSRLCILGDTDAQCVGAAKETINCKIDHCGVWSSWSKWSLIEKPESDVDEQRNSGALSSAWIERNNPASEARPAKTFKRNRNCLNGAPGFPSCIGPKDDIFICEEQNCPKLTDWSDWVVVLSEGIIKRTRDCVNNDEIPCDGDLVETRDCTAETCPTWTSWTEWSGICKDENCTKERIRTLSMEGFDEKLSTVDEQDHSEPSTQTVS